MKPTGRKVSLSFFLIVLACVLLVSSCVAEGDAGEVAPAGMTYEEAAALRTTTYNTAVKNEDRLSMGSWQWMTYAEALEHQPSLPLPEAYKGCSIEACTVALSTKPLSLEDMKDGKVYTVPATPDNLQRVLGLYSDGVTTYRLEFIAEKITNDSIRKQSIGEVGYLLTSSDTGEVEGIGLERDGYALNLYDGDAGDPFEVSPGLSINTYLAGTSKATEANASGLLQDPELTELFEALIAFVTP